MFTIAAATYSLTKGSLDDDSYIVAMFFGLAEVLAEIALVAKVLGVF